MNNTRLYTVVIMLFTLVQIIVSNYFWTSKEEKIKKSIENAQNNFISTYYTIFSTYATVPKIVFDGRINNNYFSQILKNAYETKDKEYKDLLREEIYSELNSPYKTALLKNGFEELNFYLKDGEKFLSFSHPKEFGENYLEKNHILKTVAQEMIPMEGFESGKYAHGYKYVYPMFKDGDYVGSASITLSINNYLNMAADALGGEQRFIIKSDILREKVEKSEKKRYRRSCLDSDYFFLRGDNQKMFELLSNQPKEQKDIIKDNLENERFFSTLIESKQTILAIFYPMFDTSNEINGYIIGLVDFPEIGLINKEFYKNISFSISSLFLLFLLMIAYGNQNKLLKKLKASSENLEKQVERRTSELSHNAKFLRTIFETVPAPIFYKNTVGIYLECNDAFANISGMTKDEIIGNSAEDVFSKDIVKVFKESDKAILDSNSSYQFDTSITFADGKEHHVIIHKNLLMLNDQVAGIIGVVLDITKRKKYQKELEGALAKIQSQQKEIERDYRIIEKYTIHSRTDLEWKIYEVSKAFEEVSGYKKEELIGKRHPMLQRKEPDDPMYTPVRESIKTKGYWEGEFLNFRKDGRKFWTRTKIMPEIDEHGKHVGFTTFSQDISNEKRIEEHAKKDELTQIFNRRMFNEDLSCMISLYNRHKDDTALVLFDIDKFKEINDIHGHLIGDKILIEMAKIVGDNIRDCDTFARWGGEEFVLLLPKTNLENAIITTQKIREIIISHDFGINQSITCSFGVTTFEEGDDNISVIQRVDDMLYRAKDTGRDKIIHA